MPLTPKINFEMGIQFRPELLKDAETLEGPDYEKRLDAAAEELERRNIRLRLPGSDGPIKEDRARTLKRQLATLSPNDRHDVVHLLDDLVKGERGLERSRFFSFIPLSVDLRENSHVSDHFSLNDGKRNYGALLEHGEDVSHRFSVIEWALNRVEQGIANVVISQIERDAADEGLETLARLAETGSLRKIVRFLLTCAHVGEDEIVRNDLVNTLAGFAEAEMRRKGTTRQSFGVPNPHYPRNFETWTQLADRLRAERRAIPSDLAVSERIGRIVRGVDLDGRVTSAGVRPTEGNRITTMATGDEAFETRMTLLKDAKESIRLASWAIYDDKAGNAVADVLAQKASEGKTVQFIVDDQIAAEKHHHEMFERMQKAGVQIVRFREPSEPFFGSHRKLMVVDDRAAIVGGMNVGDFYFWSGAEDKPRWQDTDNLIEGPAVGDLFALFASVWNEQKRENPNVAENITRIEAPEVERARSRSASEVPGGERVFIIDHAPGRVDPVSGRAEANILQAYLVLIEAAKDSIDIDQAYFLKLEPIHEALMDALARGVRVRILTNSRASVDLPALAGPMMAGLHELEEAGAEVYLKRGDPSRGADARGDTEHSKFMVVDGRSPSAERPVYTLTGSFNLHWRSHVTEGENVVLVESSGDDPKSTGRVHAGIFEERLQPERARRVSADFLRRGSDNFLTRLLMVGEGQL